MEKRPACQAADNNLFTGEEHPQHEAAFRVTLNLNQVDKVLSQGVWGDWEFSAVITQRSQSHLPPRLLVERQPRLQTIPPSPPVPTSPSLLLAGSWRCCHSLPPLFSSPLRFSPLLSPPPL